MSSGTGWKVTCTNKKVYYVQVWPGHANVIGPNMERFGRCENIGNLKTPSELDQRNRPLCKTYLNYMTSDSVLTLKEKETKLFITNNLYEIQRDQAKKEREWKREQARRKREQQKR